MTKFVIGIVGLSLVAASASAAVYLKFEQITVANTAIGFTAANINAGGGHLAATSATCRVRTAEISYTIDGTTPTSSVGALLEIGDVLTLSGNDVLQNFLAIRTTSTSGQIDCTYSR